MDRCRAVAVGRIELESRRREVVRISLTPVAIRWTAMSSRSATGGEAGRSQGGPFGDQPVDPVALPESLGRMAVFTTTQLPTIPQPRFVGCSIPQIATESTDVTVSGGAESCCGTGAGDVNGAVRKRGGQQMSIDDVCVCAWCEAERRALRDPGQGFGHGAGGEDKPRAGALLGRHDPVPPLVCWGLRSTSFTVLAVQAVNGGIGQSRRQPCR